MSGGIAYSIHAEGTFDEKKFNLEMVELEDLTIKIANTVKDFSKSQDYTSSSKAASILKDWPVVQRTLSR